MQRQITEGANLWGSPASKILVVLDRKLVIAEALSKLNVLNEGVNGTRGEVQYKACGLTSSGGMVDWLLDLEISRSSCLKELLEFSFCTYTYEEERTHDMSTLCASIDSRVPSLPASPCAPHC